MSHTPGPWKYLGACPYRIQVGIGSKENPWRFVAYTSAENDTDNLDTIEANARLIAAAPELLEALEEIMQMFDDGGDCKSFTAMFGRARAAIRKARGE